MLMALSERGRLAGSVLDWPVRAELISSDGSGKREQEAAEGCGSPGLEQTASSLQGRSRVGDHMVLYFTAGPVRSSSAASIDERERVVSEMFVRISPGDGYGQ